MRNQNYDVDIQDEFREESKGLLLILYISSICAVGFSIYGIVSSVILDKDQQYYKWIQICIIILLVLTIISFPFFISVTRSTNKAPTDKKFVNIGFFLLAGCSCSFMLSSILVSLPKVYCDCYIGHKEYVSKSLISILQMGNYYPQCDQLKENKKYTVQELIYALTAQIIVQLCAIGKNNGEYSELNNNEECEQLDTLVVENWSSMFINQIISFVGLSVFLLGITAIVYILQQRQKDLIRQYNKKTMNKKGRSSNYNR